MGKNNKYSKLISISDNLYSAVSEQQHTISSLGWVKEGKLIYSKAGARKEQFEKIELLIKSYTEELDNSYAINKITEQNDPLKILLKIRDLALELCDFSHREGCFCKQCTLIKLIQNTLTES